MMLRCFYVCLCCVFFSLNSSAQETAEVPVNGTKIGFRGGYGYANLKGDGLLETSADALENASALSFGAFVEFPIGRIFSIRPGVEINRRGTTVKVGSDRSVFGASVPRSGAAKTRFTYLDVPVLVQATLPTEGRIAPYLFVGVTPGYAVGGNMRITAEEIIEFNLMTADIDLEEINYDRFHVAAAGGVGVRVRLSAGFSAFVEGRFEQSLTDSYELPRVTERDGYEGVNIGAGVRFVL